MPTRLVLVPTLAALALVAGAAAAPDRVAPRLTDFAVSATTGPRFAGDRRLLATISPNGDGLRDRAAIRLRLSEPARLKIEISRTISKPIPVFTREGVFGRGRHTIFWSPATLGPRTYLVRVTATDRAGNRAVYGPAAAKGARPQTTPVIRVLGIDAGFGQASYAAGQAADLVVATDAPAFTLQFFRAGPEPVPTYEDNVMRGVPVSAPTSVSWRARRHRSGTHWLRIPALPTGLYFARLEARDGRLGFAPFVVRPATPGEHRVAVVLPTHTWQAYNFRDEDGDGWGDTWYTRRPRQPVKLGRAFLRRGVPPHYRKYELGFLRWLEWRGNRADFLSDSDLERVDGATLAKRYDLLVFPGHHEYVTERVFDAVTRYRDLGGNLAFLSANNFFWRVRREGSVLHRTVQFRHMGKPEAALIGVGYRGNDSGQRQKPFVVRSATTAPWLWDGTGLADGATFGDAQGGFGIEIDSMSPASPPGTLLLAEIPELYGAGYSAHMTYYETAAGAKVFAAGALNFGGRALFWPQPRLLDNLWARLSVP